jgi:Lactoylglutathione lyase and related lyases
MANDKIKGMGFHHIGLKVADFEKSLDFYENGLGMKKFAAWGEGNGRIQMLDLGDGGILELFAGGGDHLATNGKWVHFAMKVDDVASAYATALAAGATTIMEPKVVTVDSTAGKLNLNVAFVRGFDGEELEFFKFV